MSRWSPVPHAFARIASSIRKAALALPGVHAVLTGEEFCAGTDSLMTGVDAPKVTRFALAHGRRALRRRMGRGGGRRHARARRGRGRAGRGRVRAAAARDRCRSSACAPGAPLVHPAHGSNVILAQEVRLGAGRRGFREGRSTSSPSARRWGRSSSTVPIETFGVAAQWDPAHRDPRRLGLDPDAEISRPGREGAAAAGQRRARALRRRRRRQLRREARPQAHGARRLSREEARRAGALHRGPPREHARRRHAGTRPLLRHAGRVRLATATIRALEDPRGGRLSAPTPAARRFQLGKPVTAICGPYRIPAVEYDATSASLTNKTPQEAVRGFGQSPTNFAIERTIDRVARSWRWTGSQCGGTTSSATTNFPTPSRRGSTYDTGDYHAVLDKALAATDYPALVAQARRRAQERQARRHRRLHAASSPRAAIRRSSRCFNPKNETTTWMDSCSVNVDRRRHRHRRR